MSSQLTSFVRPITGPLNDLQGHLSRMADLHREAHTRLRSHGTALTAGGFDAFVGESANAFSDAIGQYIASSEQYMQLLDQAINAAGNCIREILGAVETAFFASLDVVIVEMVFSEISLEVVLKEG